MSWKANSKYMNGDGKPPNVFFVRIKETLDVKKTLGVDTVDTWRLESSSMTVCAAVVVSLCGNSSR